MINGLLLIGIIQYWSYRKDFRQELNRICYILYFVDENYPSPMLPRWYCLLSIESRVCKTSYFLTRFFFFFSFFCVSLDFKSSVKPWTRNGVGYLLKIIPSYQKKNIPSYPFQIRLKTYLKNSNSSHLKIHWISKSIRSIFIWIGLF